MDSKKVLLRLLNYSDSTFKSMKRCNESDLQALCPTSTIDFSIPSGSGSVYDRPIAVLVGPNSGSYADISAWQLTYVPQYKVFWEITDGWIFRQMVE